MDSQKNPQIMTHVHKSLNYTLFDAKFIPKSARFVCLGSSPKGAGVLQVYEITNEECRGDVKLLKDLEKSAAFKCGTFGAASVQTRCLATGDFNGNLSIWDLESASLPVYSVKAHKEIINSIDGIGGLGIGNGAPELVTGSRDGSVKVWDPRQKDIPVANMEVGEGEIKRDCWCVSFGNSYNNQQRVVCAGYDNGDIKMFDLKTMSLQWETNVKNGVCGLEFDRKDIVMNKLVATTLESTFHTYDLRTHHANKGYTSLAQKAHDSTIWCVKHLPQNRDIFITAGGNGTVNLWKYNYPSARSKEDSDGMDEGVMGTLSKLQNTTLSTQPIASFDWSADKEGLAVCSSFDQVLRVLVVTKLNKI